MSEFEPGPIFAPRKLRKAFNRWNYLQQATVFHLMTLGNEKVIPQQIADTLVRAFEMADANLKRTTFAAIATCKDAIATAAKAKPCPHLDLPAPAVSQPVHQYDDDLPL